MVCFVVRETFIYCSIKEVENNEQNTRRSYDLE